MASPNCLACGVPASSRLADLASVPVVANDLHATAAAARGAACGDMQIHYCGNCHHFFNSAFDESLISYSANYETSLHFSAVFRKYASEVVDMLVDANGVRNKRILEVGCGRGEFLNSLCAAGDNHGIGFDTSYDGGATIGDRHPNLVIHNRYFDADLELEPLDLVVSQQVLEHVRDPRGFLDTLVNHPSVAGNDALLYLEVPNGLYTFESDGIWDLIYEHVSYFSVDSLRRIVRQAGCSIIECGESYGGQYLYLVARIDGLASDDGAHSRSYSFVQGFADRFSSKVARWRSVTDNPEAAARTFVWGAGSKGITFCNIVDPEARLGGLVDRHPNKRGKHIPVTGLGVIGADELNPSAVDTVIVMNPLYAGEIRHDLQRAGMTVDVVEA